MRSYLVVANQTLGGEHLIAKVRDCMAAGPCRFHVVVPATPPSDHAWTEGEARALAQSRLDAALARLREVGAEVDGQVGDQNPSSPSVTPFVANVSTRSSCRPFLRAPHAG